MASPINAYFDIGLDDGPKLKRIDDYEDWAKEIMLLFKSHRMNRLFTDWTMPTEPASSAPDSDRKAYQRDLEIWEDADRKASCIIQWSLPSGHSYKLRDLSTAKEVWEEVRRLYTLPDSLRFRNVYRRLQACSLDQYNDVHQYGDAMIKIKHDAVAIKPEYALPEPFSWTDLVLVGTNGGSSLN